MHRAIGSSPGHSLQAFVPLGLGPTQDIRRPRDTPSYITKVARSPVRDAAKVVGEGGIRPADIFIEPTGNSPDVPGRRADCGGPFAPTESRFEGPDVIRRAEYPVISGLATCVTPKDLDRSHASPTSRTEWW